MAGGTVVAIDAGTTGVRTVAVDEAGRVGARAYRELTQHYPRPGEVEHDPDEIWAAVAATLAEVVAGLDGPVAAVGITNQRETVVAWDRRTGRPRHRAIVWQDRRTASRCRQLEEDGHLALVRDRTGLVLDPYFSASKMEWLLGEGGVAADEHLALGTVDSWVLWNLTGGRVHATDPSNASRTMLFDIRRQAWSPELCELFGVPMAALPEVRPSSGRFAMLDFPGLDSRVPVSGIAGDQQAALFGQACFEPGMAKNTYGTGSFVLVNAGEECPPPVEGLLTTVAWTLGDAAPVYALEGAIFVTGATVSWLRDGLGIIAEAADVEELAASVRDTEGVYLVPAFAGLGSPWWDPWARGTVVGLTRGTGRAHLARAALEAMAYQTRDVVGGHERRRRPAGDRPAGRRRGVGQRPHAPDAGRPAPGAGGPQRGHRDDGAGCGLPRRSGRGGLVVDRRGGRVLATGRRVPAPVAALGGRPPPCGVAAGRPPLEGLGPAGRVAQVS